MPLSDFQKWYKKNGEELNRTRRTRYRKDKKFREGVKQQNRESSQRYRDRLREEGVILVDGKRVSGEYVADIMRSLGRKPTDIIPLRRSGIVPEFTYTSPAAVSPEQAQLLRDFLEAQGTPTEEQAAITMKRRWIDAS